MKKRIVLFFIVIICICSCYDIVYVGIADRYMGIFQSRQKIFGDGYDKYLYLNIKSGGLIIYFGGEGDTDIENLPGYERINFINFIGDGNVYNFSNNDYVGKLVFRSDNQVEVTIKGQGIFNLENIVCDKLN
ncbi:hypothetical protein [Brachyspira pilosicoli]|uniref:Uncharacterized protein n=1 Tax=Brachyspira pilosicoli TaxID=52584 RepID=A0AAJ6K8Q9_BRAPL|nr:hypothetical protein [Brachyspira pilosicoli]WIH88691.1 hypothetical protein NEI05_03185 [Brachyspira pilosicoli]WIH90959.1 hypothetical protein NEI02_03115 [Brachyspira pilosicoli]WIH93250.1 hypothetical protein NEI01_03115 [Brachyspira pilosicoli]WIH95540.1 hypothetical protein NEH99_03110 [Brachyspira pilosicoli]